MFFIFKKIPSFSCILIISYVALTVLSSCQKERLPPNQLYINAYDSFTGETVEDISIYRYFRVGSAFWGGGWATSDTLQTDMDNLVLNDSVYSPRGCMEDVRIVHTDYHGIWTYSGFCDKDSTLIDTINFEVKPLKQLYIVIKPQKSLGYIKVRVLDNETEYTSFRYTNWLIGEELIDCREGLSFQDTTMIVPVIQDDTLRLNVTYIEAEDYDRREKKLEIVTNMDDIFDLEIEL